MRSPVPRHDPTAEVARILNQQLRLAAMVPAFRELFKASFLVTWAVLPPELQLQLIQGAVGSTPPKSPAQAIKIGKEGTDG